MTEPDHSVTGQARGQIEARILDLSQGGALCSSCRRGVAVSEDALVVVREILGGGLARALQEPPSQVTAEVEDLAVRAIEAHLERRLRSVRAWSGPGTR